MEWTQITITSLMTAIVTLAGQYFVSYLRKKGENLATKEDIGRLTEIVENVKSQFAVDLEFIRFNLGNKSTIQRLAAEKEFGALSEIAGCLFQIQSATERLRPKMLESNEPLEERYKRCSKEWIQSHNAFVEAVRKHRWFLPHRLFLRFSNIGRSSNKEYEDFRTDLKMGGGQPTHELSDQAEKNILELTEMIDETFLIVRRRWGTEE